MSDNLPTQCDKPQTANAPALDILGRLLSAIPAVAVAGTAFLYLAGFTYLRDYRGGFGLLFGATESTIPEVIAEGYTVVLFFLIEKVPEFLKMVALEFALVILLTALIVYGIRRKNRHCLKIQGMLDKSSAGISRSGRHLLLLCALGLLLIGASPAGTYAAKFQRDHTLKKVRQNCCFVYSLPKKSVRGYPLAQDHNHIWLLDSNGLTVLPLDNLTIHDPASLGSRNRNKP